MPRTFPLAQHPNGESRILDFLNYKKSTTMLSYDIRRRIKDKEDWVKQASTANYQFSKSDNSEVLRIG